MPQYNSGSAPNDDDYLSSKYIYLPAGNAMLSHLCDVSSKYDFCIHSNVFGVFYVGKAFMLSDVLAQAGGFCVYTVTIQFPMQTLSQALKFAFFLQPVMIYFQYSCDVRPNMTSVFIAVSMCVCYPIPYGVSEALKFAFSSSGQ